MAPTISDGPPPPATIGTPYRFTYVASSSPAPTFSVTSGALPAGLTLSPTGVISGTPTAQGSYRGAVTATNASGSDTQSFNLGVVGPAVTLGPTVPEFSPPLSVREAFGPFREVVLVVAPSCVLTQYDAFGAHVLGGGVRSASVAFDAEGNEVILVVRPDDSLAQYDRLASHSPKVPGQFFNPSSFSSG